jgi:AcrR family transcriptional regulator
LETINTILVSFVYGDKMKDIEVRKKIIENSFKMIKETGLRFTMDEIATNLGMSKKTIYKHFGSRSELIDAIIEHQTGIVKGVFMDAFSPKGDLLEGLQKLFTRIPHEIGLLSKKFLEDLRKYEPEKWDKIEAFRTKMLKENFPRIFSQGIKSGYFRPDINFDILLSLYISAIQSIVNPTVLSQSSFSAEEAIINIMRVFFLGITTEKGQQKFKEVEKKLK